ncbi:MAG: glycosyltransferase, partial [Muribaculaceae bacterium]|nr:glycosyltransferase [Muribaculaceae bacterium]
YFEFVPTIHHDRLPEFYQGLDLFVLPSYWEAFGCVYTEAYACGVPFIGVKGQGISEIIPNEAHSEWLVDKGDYNGLAGLIGSCMKNAGVKQTLTTPIDIDFLIKGYLEYIKK